MVPIQKIKFFSLRLENEIQSIQDVKLEAPRFQLKLINLISISRNVFLHESFVIAHLVSVSQSDLLMFRWHFKMKKVQERLLLKDYNRQYIYQTAKWKLKNE